MFLNILVAVDGSPSARSALGHGVDLAHAFNASLTLITVAPPVSTYVVLAGVSVERMQGELEGWAERILAEAVASLPEDVSAHRVVRSGPPGPEILEEVHHGGYDLVVLGTRGRGRAQEGMLGSVNGFLHFHAHVPILSVPE